MRNPHKGLNKRERDGETEIKGVSEKGRESICMV